MTLHGTLADPTDFGNKPGDGPLRPGGKAPSSDPQRQENLPSTLSPAARKQREALELVRDLEGGALRVRERSTVYLPKNPAEERQNYANRLERSVFFNAFGETLQGLTGLVFHKDPVLGDDIPGLIVEHWENIDLAGTHGDVFTAELFRDGLTTGHAAILVDYPDTQGESLTAAEEQARQLRPYWLPILKDNILSWRTTVEDGRTILSQVVLRETQSVPDGFYGEQEQVRYRVLYRRQADAELDGEDVIGVIVGWQLLEVTKDKKVVEVGRGLYANQVEIPLAEIITSGRKSIFDSTPPLLDLALLNVAHYQAWSDYAWSINLTNVPILFMAGLGPKEDRPVVIGANTAITSENPEAKLTYVSHTGAALESSRQALEDIKSDMGTLGIAMLAPQKRAAETAEAKRLDKATSDSKLGTAARGLQDGLERALGFHARYLKLEDGGSIEINRDFEGLLLDAPVMTAYAKLAEAGFPPRIVLEALQKGGRIAPDADLDELELEMAAGAVAVGDADRRRA